MLVLEREPDTAPCRCFETVAAPGEVADALRRLQAAGFAEALVKSAVGASGIGLLKVPSLEEGEVAALRVPGHFFCEGAAPASR